MDNNLEMTIMQLITCGGDVRGKAIEAIRTARNGDFEKADKLLIESEEALVEAHQYQTNLLFQESSGNPVPFSILLLHAEDHTMNAMTVKELAAEIIENLRKAVK